ncbi:MAG: ATP-binding protein, partial [Lachnospiraceae bacterium]|nr:ATP-binding protein [Lachnospiraceae bacterium]
SFLSCLVLLVKNVLSAEGNVYVSQAEGELAGCVSFGVIIWSVHCLGRPLGSVLDNKIRKWYLLLALPLALIVLLVDIVNYGASIGILVVAGLGRSGGEYWKEFYNELFSHTAICILTALSMCAAGFYVFGMNRIYVEQRKKEQYKSQAAFYKMLEEQYGQMERLRHDMKNHIIGLRGLWENREWEKLGSYLEQMMEAGNLASEENTGSGAVDALLYQKHRQAKERQVIWECDMQIPGKCPIDEFDLCVLLGNMLDNALAACEKADAGEKFVSIHAGQVKKCLLLEVRNSTCLKSIKEISLEGKTAPGEHGIGLLNIKDTVGKYDGAMHMETEGGIFTISLLLPLNQCH